jgi:predicted type IV restriction endonuclease
MSQPEAFSRILIDKALEFSGWNLLNTQQIQFEQHTGTGRVDYLLTQRSAIFSTQRHDNPYVMRLPLPLLLS